MNCDSRGRWPCLGTTPVLLLLVLCLHLQGSASRCIDTSFGQDLQPLPPSAQRCSIPSGLLQPDVSPPGQGGDGIQGGDTRIVGGSPATSGGHGGGSSTGRPSSQGDSPFQYGRPGKGRLEGPILGGGPAQYDRPRGPGPYGSGTPQDGPGPVRIGSPAEQYGGGSYGGSNSGFGIRDINGPRGFPRPVWKRPGIPYIPTPEERGGGYIPLSKVSPQYDGGAGSYSSGHQYSSTYSGESIASGPKGRYDGSYGPIPEGMQPGGQRGRDGGEHGPPCIPNC